MKVTHDLEAGVSENLLLLLVGETNKKNKCLDVLDLKLHFEKVGKVSLALPLDSHWPGAAISIFPVFPGRPNCPKRSHDRDHKTDDTVKLFIDVLEKNKKQKKKRGDLGFVLRALDESPPSHDRTAKLNSATFN